MTLLPVFVQIATENNIIIPFPTMAAVKFPELEVNYSEHWSCPLLTMEILLTQTT